MSQKVLLQVTLTSFLAWSKYLMWKKLILSYTEPRFDYVNLFIIDFACKPKSESDFYSRTVPDHVTFLTKLPRKLRSVCAQAPWFKPT